MYAFCLFRWFLKAINQMDQMTQQNAGLVKEAASASKAMGEQAGNLNSLVGFFTIKESPANERRSQSRPWSDENKPAASA